MIRSQVALCLLAVAIQPSAAIGQIAQIIGPAGDGVNTLDAVNVGIDAAGNVYAVGSNTDNAFRIAASTTCSTGGTPCTITEIIDDTGDGTGDIDMGTGNFLDRAAAVATDSAGNVYVVGQFSDNVFRIMNPSSCSTGGTPCSIAEIIDGTGDGTGNLLDTPTSIAIDDSDNVYVGGATSDNVFRIAASTTCSTGGSACTITEILDSTSGIDQPAGVAVDGSGNVFVTHQNSANVVQIATPTTCSTGGTPCTVTELMDGTGDGAGNTFFFGRGIITDIAGNVYATALGFGSTNLPRIFRIDTPGTCSTGGTPCRVTEIAERLNGQQYSGLAIDGAGNLFVAGGNGDDALRFDTPTECSSATCTSTTIIDATGDGGSNILDGPGQVAIAKGSVYVASSGNADGVFRINNAASTSLQVFIAERRGDDSRRSTSPDSAPRFIETIDEEGAVAEEPR